MFSGTNCTVGLFALFFISSWFSSFLRLLLVLFGPVSGASVEMVWLSGESTEVGGMFAEEVHQQNRQGNLKN